MPKAKYHQIYQELKERIETDVYAYQAMLPSEHALVSEFDCSRNTVRRAMADLTAEGYVQPIHGKGVRNIYLPAEQTTFTVGGIESFSESAARNHRQAATRVLKFEEMTADAKMAKRMGFAEGAPLIHILRLRYLDDKPLILDHNYFLKEMVPGLTVEIASSSIYAFLEDTLGLTIAVSKRTMTVERVTRLDEQYLALKDYNCMAVVTSQTYEDKGVQFEYTQSRHRPDTFIFQDVATRRL